MSAIRAVLWDADGVLQEVPGGWRALLIEAIGQPATDQVLTEIWPVAKAAMAGRADLIPALDELVTRHGLVDAEHAVKEVWGTFIRFEGTRELVASIRRSGVSCHLATNQDQLRAAYMRERLGYDDLLDSSFYSCDVGAAKPSARFFGRVLDKLGLAPEQVVFVDDTEVNVTSASALGLHGICWHHRDGLDVLRSALAALGVC